MGHRKSGRSCNLGGPQLLIFNCAQEINPSNWERFKHHARRVRVLADHFESDLLHSDSDISESCWKTLRAYYAISGNTPIIPNLKALLLYFPSSVTFTGIFLHESLHTIYLGSLVMSEHEMVPIVRHLEQNPIPSLTSLTISLDATYDTELEQPLSSVVCSLGQLSTLKVDATLSEDAMYHLASLPSLVALKFALSDTDYASSSLAEITGPKFAALTTLELIIRGWPDTDGTPSATPLVSFLSGVATPPQLAEISIAAAIILDHSGIIHDEEDMPQWEFNERDYLRLLFMALGDLKADTLTDISVGLGFDFSDGFPENAVDEAILSPLLALKNIRSLCLTSTPVKPSSRLIEQMASSWPQANSLNLLGGHGDPTTGVAVEDLLPFAIRCLGLKSLAINVTHSRVTSHSQPQMSLELLPTPHRGLQTLQVDHYCITENVEDAIAFVLARVFPDVKVLKADGPWDSYDRLNALVAKSLDRLD